MGQQSVRAYLLLLLLAAVLQLALWRQLQKGLPVALSRAGLLSVDWRVVWRMVQQQEVGRHRACQLTLVLAVVLGWQLARASGAAAAAYHLQVQLLLLVWLEKIWWGGSWLELLLLVLLSVLLIAAALFVCASQG
jgi:hypothetical protein